MGNDIKTRYLYTGPSMNFALRSFDKLSVRTYGERRIKRGDVVLFVPPLNNDTIAHRVIAVTKGGILTRGDAGKSTDPWRLAPAEIIGKVEYAYRNTKRIRVYGGWHGIVFFMLPIRAGMFFKSTVYYLCKPLYCWLSQRHCLKRILQKKIPLRILSFERQYGKELRAYVGRHLAGKRLPGSAHWDIRMPFGLFIEETRLP